MMMIVMLSASLSNDLRKREQSLTQRRRELQTIASAILSASKRSIFAVHRDDPSGTKKELIAANELMQQGWKCIDDEPLLGHEGSWRAAREEYTEAELLADYVEKGTVTVFSDRAQDPDIFIGGVSDLVGELVRRAVMLASRGEGGLVEKIYQDASEIVAFLLTMDLTGPLRTKTDQARGHLRKVEEIRYDVTMRYGTPTNRQRKRHRSSAS